MSRKYYNTPDYDNIKDAEEWLLRGVPHLVMDGIRKFTRLETEGIENIPKTGPVIVTPNHSGIWGWDGIVLMNEILKYGKRIPRAMLHDFWHKNEITKALSNKMGMIPQDLRAALRVLKKNNLLLIFPEAEEGNFKPSTKMYQIQPFNPGFVTLAMRTGAVIVPTIVIGAEETHLNFGTITWMEKLLGAKIPLPVNLIPLPVQWKMICLKPISLEKYDRNDGKNPRFIKEVAENVRLQIQNRIYEELLDRGIFNFRLDG